MSTVKMQMNIAGVKNALQEILERLGRVAHVFAPPLLRVALAVPFFKSGLTKWDGVLSLSPAAVFLFEEGFKLHLFGQAYDFPLPTAVAFFYCAAQIGPPGVLMLCL